MKQAHALLLLIPLAFGPLAVHAEDKVEVQTESDVQVIEIGPGGVIDFPTKDAGNFGKLPKEIQDAMKKAGVGNNGATVQGSITIIGPDGKKHTRKLGNNEDKAEGDSADVKKETGNGVQVFSFGKAFRIGPNGKLGELEKLPKEVQEMLKKHGFGDAKGQMSGSITIIGPDGVKHTHRIGDGAPNAKALSNAIEKAMKDAGKGLPKDMREKLEQAMKGVPAMRIRPAPAKENPTADQPSNNDILKKLDEVIRRLEKLELRVDQQRSKDN